MQSRKVPLTLVHSGDESVPSWGGGILGMLPQIIPWSTSRVSAKWLQLTGYTSNPGRAVWNPWPEFSLGESLCLRYTIAMKANCPLETSLLRLNLLLLQQQCFCPGLVSFVFFEFMLIPSPI